MHAKCTHPHVRKYPRDIVLAMKRSSRIHDRGRFVSGSGGEAVLRMLVARKIWWRCAD